MFRFVVDFLAALPENRGTECGMLLTEILSLINQPNNNVLSKITTDALLNWLTHRAGNSAVLQGLFNVIGSIIFCFIFYLAVSCK